LVIAWGELIPSHPDRVMPTEQCVGIPVSDYVVTRQIGAQARPE
jgi:hypothetical protein